MKISKHLDRGRLERNLLVLISLIPERHRRITAVMKYAFFGQFEGYFPSIGKTLRYHGAYNKDIEILVEGLEKKGILVKRQGHPQSLKNAGTPDVVYSIPPSVEKQIPAIADQEGIDFSRLTARMNGLFREIGFRSSEMGAKSREYLLDLFAQKDRFLFSDQTGSPDISLPLVLAKLEAEMHDAGKIAYWILRNKENLADYTFDTKSINNVKPDGSFVFLGGYFTDGLIRETISGKVVEYTTSVINPRESVIPVLLGSGGIHHTNPHNYLGYDCIVVGRITIIAGRPTVRAAGIIQVAKLGESDIIY
ncbi:MAG: hypothetical protein ABH950_06420 [Candidatus Altiarchaeota archaeon]